MTRRSRVAPLFAVLLSSAAIAVRAQSLGGAGTIEGIVSDPSGAVVVGASVELQNPRTGYKRTATSDSNGGFRFTGVPPNTYHLEVILAGFNSYSQDVTIRSAVPVSV